MTRGLNGMERWPERDGGSETSTVINAAIRDWKLMISGASILLGILAAGGGIAYKYGFFEMHDKMISMEHRQLYLEKSVQDLTVSVAALRLKIDSFGERIGGSIDRINERMAALVISGKVEVKDNNGNPTVAEAKPQQPQPLPPQPQKKEKRKKPESTWFGRILN